MQETLPLITFAKHLAVDSRNGRLYWSTGYNIKYSWLNGMNGKQHELVQASKITSLTLHDASLYWITLEDGQAKLFESQIQSSQFSKQTATIKLVAHLTNSWLIGPLSIISNRMFWYDRQERIMQISDTQAQTFATVQGLSNIYSFAIVTGQKPANQSGQAIQVVPNMVNVTNIKFVGTWENFTLTWESVTNVNYGQMYYDLVLDSENQTPINVILNQTSYNYSAQFLRQHHQMVKPYSRVKVAIRAFTYWASSKQSTTVLFTPSSIPTQPMHVRVYTYTNQSHPLDTTKSSTKWPLFIAEARWSPPRNCNGPVLSYTVSLWNILDTSRAPSIMSRVIPNQLWYKFDSLQPNTTYYFQVRATTDAGEGPPSDIYQFKTHNQKPPSRLIITTPAVIQMLDVDNRDATPIIKSIHPEHIDYSYHEDILLYVEKSSYLKQTSILNNTGHDDFTILAHLPEPVTSISMDWIGRRLYLGTFNRKNNQSTIWCYDLSLSSSSSPSESMSSLFRMHQLPNTQIANLRVSPLESALIWTQKTTSHPFDPYTIQICQLSLFGKSCTSTRELFLDDHHANSIMSQSLPSTQCNCSYSTMLSPQFALHLDKSKVHKTKIVYFDLNEKNFAWTDLSGCQCHHHHGETLETSGSHLGPNSFTLDESDSMLYWTNSSSTYDMNKIIYSTKMQFEGAEYSDSESSTRELSLNSSTGGQSLLSYNINNQPYPRYDCLVPSKHYRPTLMAESQLATSLTLSVHLDHQADSLASNNCGSNISRASLEYRIIYFKHSDQSHCTLQRFNSLQKCKVLVTFNSTFTVDSLEPFTNYTFLVKLNNYYLKMVNKDQQQLDQVRAFPSALSTSAVTFTTAESRPGPPQNVQAIVEAPNKIRVQWARPAKVNSNQISYEVWWYSVEATRKSKRIYEHHNSTYWMQLENVEPGKQYNISVRAYSDNHLYTESEPILVQSYHNPNPLRPIRVSGRNIRLSWTSPSMLMQSSPPMYKSQNHRNDCIIQSHSLFIKESTSSGNERTWFLLREEWHTFPNKAYDFFIDHLKPNTAYKFKLVLVYGPSNVSYDWPSPPLVLTTKGDVPDTPTMLDIVQLKRGIGLNHVHPDVTIYKINWTKVKSNSVNGLNNVYYKLWVKMVSNPNELSTGSQSTTKQALLSSRHAAASATANEDDQWREVYNGTENFWIATDLESRRSYVFRVAAFNQIGASNYSNPSEPFYLDFFNEINSVEGAGSGGALATSQQDDVSVQFVVFVLILSSAGVLLFVLMLYCKLISKQN